MSLSSRYSWARPLRRSNHAYHATRARQIPGTTKPMAAPPASREEALRVAAEHFALCPDNVWQFNGDHPLETYAEQLVGRGNWIFWWD
jgi:hypothetical protein